MLASALADEFFHDQELGDLQNAEYQGKTRKSQGQQSNGGWESATFIINDG